MDGDQGALNKFEHGEFSSGIHDLVVSAEKLIGVAKTDGEQLLAAGLKTLAADAKTDLGQIVTTAVATAIGAAASGQTPPQILATVLPTLESSVVNDAKAAGQDVETVVLNTARVMLVGQQAQAVGNTAQGSTSGAATEAPSGSAAPNTGA